MVAKISLKMKITIVVLIGFLVTGVVWAYQRVFGGKARDLAVDEYVVGKKSEATPTIQKEENKIVSVAYSKDIAKGVDKVIKETGDLSFIKEGERVLIKPNVNSDDPAPGTTHPEVLAEVVRLAKLKGAYVIVGDRSNPAWKTIPAMKETGMYSAAQKAGADEIVGFEDGEWVRVSPQNAKNWPNGFRIPKIITTVDHVISVPVLHTHSIADHSLAIKNLVGIIHPTDRMLFHASANRDEMIAEISLAVKPDLTVIDGTKSFIAGGPSKGTLKNSQVYLASTDVLAADVTGVALLQKEGAKFKYDNPWESRQIKHFVTLGISTLKQDEIDKEAKNIKLIHF
jgi:uncharacterized protein (DUF362 family)